MHGRTFSKKVPVMISFIYISKVFCLKFKISITPERIGFFNLGKLHIGPLKVSGYFFRFKFWIAVSYFSSLRC